jgi:hypothetical protein
MASLRAELQKQLDAQKEELSSRHQGVKQAQDNIIK